jgi:hypothetical protein
MVTLLENFSIAQIILFIILLAIAIKSVVDFYDWLKGKVNQHDTTQQIKHDDETNTNERFNQIEHTISDLVTSVDKINKNVDTLIASDRDDIKAYITKEHHYFCYQKKWIDDYTLDCLERRFQHYVDEKGNSFIEQLMSEIRALPKQPPKDTDGSN